MGHHTNQPKPSPPQAVSVGPQTVRPQVRCGEWGGGARWHAAMPRGQQPARSLSLCNSLTTCLQVVTNLISRALAWKLTVHRHPLKPKHSNSKRQSVKFNCDSEAGLVGKEPSGGLSLDPVELSHPQPFKPQHLPFPEVNSPNRAKQRQRTSPVLRFQSITAQHTHPGGKKKMRLILFSSY